jgi:hypothetical protein
MTPSQVLYRYLLSNILPALSSTQPDITKGGGFVCDVVNTPLIPTAVLQVEARLVGEMMPLAKIMVSDYSPYRVLFSDLTCSL